jgi:hypothetical protein
MVMKTSNPITPVAIHERDELELRNLTEQKIAHIMRYLHQHICAEEEKDFEKNYDKIYALKGHYNQFSGLLADSDFLTNKKRLIQFLVEVI